MNDWIQWPRAKYWDKTWNPIIGCKPCSPACDNCYAASMAKRFGRSFAPHEGKAANPPRSGVVFCGNMTDLFGGWGARRAAEVPRRKLRPRLPRIERHARRGAPGRRPGGASVKNVEVHPMALDALDVWRSDRYTKLPFSEWLDAEAPPSTLHQAALAMVDTVRGGVRDKIVEAAQDMLRVLDSEGRKTVRRHSYFDSPSDAMKAHAAWCRPRSCANCPYNAANNPVASIPCIVRWLYSADDSRIQ